MKEYTTYEKTCSICNALEKNIRFNAQNMTVEIYNEYGVKMVLRDLDKFQLKLFADIFPVFGNEEDVAKAFKELSEYAL